MANIYIVEDDTNIQEIEAIALKNSGHSVEQFDDAAHFYKKLEEKGIHYNVFQGNDEVEGYQKKNFHNQYLQTFAELGVVGFILLLLILGVNLKNALKNKDFLHIAFAILMISLFLTESFLWRQTGALYFIIFYCLFNNNNEYKKQ